MHTLTSQDWLFISKLWAELADHHMAQVDEALEHLRQSLYQERGIYQMFGLFSERLCPPQADPLNGWRPVITNRGALTPTFYIETGKRWAEEAELNLMGDDWMRLYTQRGGTSRVMWRPEHVETPWHKLPCGAWMSEVEAKDRIYMGLALTPTLEFTLCMDSHISEEDFEQRDAHFAQALLMGLKPLVLRLALSHGLLEGQERLSPRERETLLLLLRGGSEKEIAEELGLSYKTLHQYVVSVYRKFGVHSRAELLALWLGPPMHTRAITGR